jgi:hypothetical protein
MTKKQISDAAKSRLHKWIKQHAGKVNGGLHCSICNASGPALGIGDIDVCHTIFAARCHLHTEAAPPLRNLYGVVVESRQAPNCNPPEGGAI